MQRMRKLNGRFGCVMSIPRRTSGAALLSVLIPLLLLLAFMGHQLAEQVQAEFQLMSGEYQHKRVLLEAQEQLNLALEHVVELGPFVDSLPENRVGGEWSLSFHHSSQFTYPLIQLKAWSDGQDRAGVIPLSQQYVWLPLLPDLPTGPLLAEPVGPHDELFVQVGDAQYLWIDDGHHVAGAALLRRLSEPTFSSDLLMRPAAMLLQTCVSLNQQSRGFHIVRGDCHLQGNVGQPAQPLILLVQQGHLSLAPQTQFHGIVVLLGADDEAVFVDMEPGAQITGSLVSLVPIQRSTGALRVVFDAQMMAMIRQSSWFYRLYALAGSWRDW